MSVSKTSLLGRYRAGKPIPARFLNAVTARAERAAKEADRKTIAYRPLGRGGKMIVAIFDGTRNGKVYTGHLLNLTTGAAETTAVQWMFWGDRYGTDDLVTKNTPVVLTHKCPAYLENDKDWSPTGGAKYMAVLSPFAMLA